jgi:opacity protein-like surface antigen
MKALLLAAALLAIASPAAAATNLVSNPGFEINGVDSSTVIADWDNVDDGHFIFTDYNGVASYEGSFHASSGCVLAYCTISQTIATQAGQHYTLSFAFNPGGGVELGDASTFVSFGGVDISPDIGVGPLGWNIYSYTVIGSGSDTLAFRSFQKPAFTGIDAVSLTAVPEPASWALLIAGFGLTGAAIRRRRAAVAA